MCAYSTSIQPHLIVFAGVNGVGKSTFYHSGLWRFPGMPDKIERINPDEILLHQKGSSDSAADQLKAGREALSRIEACLEAKRSFNQETTLSSHTAMKTIKRAKELGYRVLLYYVGVQNETIALKRIAHRKEIGGHNIDEHLVRRRFKSSLKNFSRVLDYCDQATVLDNTENFRVIAQWEMGLLTWVGNLKVAGGWLLSAMTDESIWRNA